MDGVPQITKGYQPITERYPTRVEFMLEGKNCCIILDGMKNIFTYNHQFLMEGSIAQEARESANIGMHEKIPSEIKPLSPKVSAGVALYGFDVMFPDGSKVTIYRRYSQFVMLDSLLRAQLDYHMISSLPPLPGKVYNPYFNQLSPAFLAERQSKLGSYLSQLQGNSKVIVFICCVQEYDNLLFFLSFFSKSGVPLH